VDSDRVQLTAREFIERVFVQELANLKCGTGPPHYLQCTLIGLAIESLAEVVKPSCTDNLRRFNAVLERMPGPYKQFTCEGKNSCPWSDPRKRPAVRAAYCLYHGWRCGSAHRLRPFGIKFTHAAEAAREGTNHLGFSTAGNLVLVSETLVHDFKRMCQGILDDNSLKAELVKPWLHVGVAS
jgi:hypothetical protein